MIMNGQAVKIWKYTGMAYLKILFPNSLGESEKATYMNVFSISLVKIRTGIS